MTVTLKKVLENEKVILRNLYSLYLHDLSQFTAQLNVNEEGFFEYDGLDQFFEVDGLSPYFIKQNGEIAGFVMLVERPFLKKDNDFGVNDLFILNTHKGRGVGTSAIKQLFQEKQGKYFVIELRDNKPAISFWKKIYHSLHINYDERQEAIDGEPCLIQTFNTKMVG